MGVDVLTLLSILLDSALSSQTPEQSFEVLQEPVSGGPLSLSMVLICQLLPGEKGCLGKVC